MSHQATTWVMEFSESRLADRLVLGAIAHRVSNDNGEAFPSVKTIAHEANVSESSVHASLKSLKELGELEIDRGASKYGTNVFRMPKFMAWMEALHVSGSGVMGGSKSVPLPKPRGSNPRSRGVQSLGAKGTNPAPEPSGTVIEPSGAAPDRGSQDTRISVEKSERRSTDQVKKLAKDKSLPCNSRPTEPLRAEIWDALYWNQIEKPFLDGHRLSFEERVLDTVHAAVTLAVTNRVGKLMVLRAGDIEMLAVEKLKPQLKALKAIPDLPTNSRSFVRTIAEHVRTAVTNAAAELLEGQGGFDGAPGARPPKSSPEGALQVAV